MLSPILNHSRIHELSSKSFQNYSSLCSECATLYAIVNHGKTVNEQKVLKWDKVMQPIDKKRSKKGKKVYLPLAQAIRTVCFCGPNATMARASSGIRNCANDHSELKYLGNTPATRTRSMSVTSPLIVWNTSHHPQFQSCFFTTFSYKRC